MTKVVLSCFAGFGADTTLPRHASGQRSASMAATGFLAPINFLVLATLLYSKLLPESTVFTESHAATDGNNLIQICTQLRVSTAVFLSSRRKSLDAILNLNFQARLLCHLLLLGGDISVNPGPQWKFPCTICTNPVKTNQRGICCDQCDRWLHTQCCNVSDSTYENLANSSCAWICPECGSSNFLSSALNSISEVDLSNSFSILDNLHVDLTTTTTTTTSSSIPVTSSPNLGRKSYPNPSNITRKNKLTGLIINCNGLKSTSRFTEFQALLDLHDPGIVLGTESKLDEGIPTYSIFPSNYTVFRRDRNCHGGGVFQAIKSDLVSMEEPRFSNESEIIWTSLKLNNCKTLYLASFYRPPNSTPDVLVQLHDSINEVFTKTFSHPNIVIGGDFNLGDIDWNTAPYSGPSAQHQTLLHLIDDFSLSQHVKEPTRPASWKILDLLLSTFPNSVSRVTTTTGMSDHLAILFDLNLKPTRSFKAPHKVYAYKRADFESLGDYMQKSSDDFFASHLEKRTIDTNWNMFKQSLLTGISKFVPQRLSGSKYKLPWITHDIKRQMRKKDRLYKKAIRTKIETTKSGIQTCQIISQQLP